MICVQIELDGSNYPGACAQGECPGLSGSGEGGWMLCRQLMAAGSPGFSSFRLNSLLTADVLYELHKAPRPHLPLPFPLPPFHMC